jgi:hypothetical protein
MKVRPARSEDVPEILAMLRESAVDQGEPDAVIAPKTSCGMTCSAQHLGLMI